VHSCFYEGHVRHRRHRPLAHAFAFPLFMLYLDLDELPELFADTWLWSARRPALAWFRRADHLGSPARPLDECVRELVRERTDLLPSGPIRLLTHLRYAGFAMNPVSFYYCFDARGQRVEALVAEVTNTPWRERHCYVVLPDRALHARTAKRFHVSPFLPMGLDYQWKLRAPGASLALRIEAHEPGGGAVFDASLAMRRREWSARTRAAMLARHPLMTLQVAAGIYRQALGLHRRGAPFHAHPAPVEAS
jgi:DUF1365 family protein